MAESSRTTDRWVAKSPPNFIALCEAISFASFCRFSFVAAISPLFCFAVSYLLLRSSFVSKAES